VLAGHLMRAISARPITEDAFAPYGQILKLPAEPGRIDYSAFLRNDRPKASACFRTSLIAPETWPVTVTVMERHAYSTQAFLPIDVDTYLVLVAPSLASGQPDVGQLCAFQVGPDIGINYSAGTWHHPMTVFDRPAVFATVMWTDGGPDDEEFVDVSPAVQVSSPNTM